MGKGTMKRDPVIHAAANQKGLALLTVMLLMLIMTVIGIAAITVTGLENRMAGYLRTGEAAASASESCLGTGVNVIQQTIDMGSLPAAFLDNAAPAGPVPQANGPILNTEIMGQSDNNADLPTVAPNMVATVNTFTVRGDIDRLYAKAKAGGSLQFAAGYEGTAGGAAGGGIDLLYRIDCRATNAATGTASRITAIYACTATGESCQKKI
ncbi:MAG: pilus assembly PilX family protein [Nitrospiraceae bacterium]